MDAAIFVLKQLGHWSLGKTLIYALLAVFVLYEFFGD